MGKVYILTNDLMPGIIKIGITEGSVEDRIKSLDNTSLPLPFRFYYAIESERFKQIEAHMLNAFADFFKLDPERAVAALGISGDPEIKLGNAMIDDEGKVVAEAPEEQKSYRRRFSFVKVGVPVGAELRFTRDKAKVCKVVSETEVEYQGQRYSLSGLAAKLIGELGYEWKAIQGPRFFEYNDKTLSELRDEWTEGETDE
jgi:hypothetical protein